MSSPIENIKIVKRLYALFAEKNINSILEMLSPDVEWGEPEIRLIRLEVHDMDIKDS